MASLFALESEIRSIAKPGVDHAVAHLKLQWWRDEIRRLELGEPRHPRTQAAMHAAPQAGPAWRPLQDLLSSIELDLASSTYETEDELDRYLGLAAGLQRAMTSALHGGPPGHALAQFACAAGEAVRGIEIMRDLRRDVSDGRVYLPLSWLATEGVAHAELRAPVLGPAPRRCLARLAVKLRDRWRLALRSLADVDAQALRGQRVLGELHVALLDRIEKRQFDVGNARVELGPGQGLWTAWRAARRH
jgi:phytoene synthase